MESIGLANADKSSFEGVAAQGDWRIAGKMMKKMLLLLVMSLVLCSLSFSSASAANWVFVEKDEWYSYHLDVDSVRAHNGAASQIEFLVTMTNHSGTKELNKGLLDTVNKRWRWSEVGNVDARGQFLGMVKVPDRPDAWVAYTPDDLLPKKVLEVFGGHAGAPPKPTTPPSTITGPNTNIVSAAGTLFYRGRLMERKAGEFENTYLGGVDTPVKSIEIDSLVNNGLSGTSNDSYITVRTVGGDSLDVNVLGVQRGTNQYNTYYEMILQISVNGTKLYEQPIGKKSWLGSEPYKCPVKVSFALEQNGVLITLQSPTGVRHPIRSVVRDGTAFSGIVSSISTDGSLILYK